MYRKFIYILVFITTIAFVLYDYQENKNENKSLQSNNEEKLKEDLYNSAEILSPLTIKNYQNDDKIIEYTYKITLSDIAGAYPYEYNGKESYILFAANGETQITIKSNETITIYGLPNDTKYKIEQLTNVSDNYTTTINDENIFTAEGKLSPDTIITFDNKTIIEEEPEQIPHENPFTASAPIFVFIIMCLISILIHNRINKIKITKYE